MQVRPLSRDRVVDAAMWLLLEAFYLITFGLAAWLKWSGGVPDWFTEQFHATWLVGLPFGLRGVFYLLAVLESVAFVGFAVSVIRLEWLRGRAVFLRFSLAFSMLVFLLLAYGSRLTQKFDIAGWNYLYLIGTFTTAFLLPGSTGVAPADDVRMESR